MTVRFTCQSEYQRSFGASRSRSVSPQRRRLSSAHMAHGRKQHHGRRLGSTGPAGPAGPAGPNAPAQSGRVWLRPPPPPVAEPAARRTSPPAAWRGRSAGRARPRPEPSLGPGAAAPEAPAEPRPPGAAEEPGRLRPPGPANHPPLSSPDGPPPSSIEVQPPSSQTGLRAGGQRSGGHRTEYLQQFGWKKPAAAAAAASPLLTAEQLLRAARIKENPVSMATEYQRSFQGLAPPSGPRLRTHLEEQQRIPLFHILSSNIKREEESERRLRPEQATPPPAQPLHTHRMLTEYESSFPSRPYRSLEGGGASDAPQAAALRQQALSYRRRAWGINFSRQHLSQLRSEHNALWEPSDSAGSAPPTPRSEGGAASCVEALDLASLCGSSSRRSSVHRSRTNTPTHTHTHTPTHTHTHTHTRAPASGAEEENSDHDEGRLPTPVLRMRPAQRTHHDVTTPVTGGAILVGRLKGEASPLKLRCDSAASMAKGGGAVPPKEAWPETTSPDRRPPSKPIRSERPLSSPVAPPPLHCIRGLLRHPDFQHNGELGLRLREPPCLAGCASDEDDRLSVMSWRSAASCSAASAVLERAQRRREDFWGKS